MKTTKDIETAYYHCQISPCPRDESERVTACGLRSRKVFSFDWVETWFKKEKSVFGLPKCPDCLASSDVGLLMLKRMK